MSSKDFFKTLILSHVLPKIEKSIFPDKSENQNKNGHTNVNYILS